MHKDIDEIYRQLHAQQQDLDTTGVWDRLEDSLDLEELWPRLDKSLTRRRRRKIAAIALVCLLIPAGAYLIYSLDRNEASNSIAENVFTPDNKQPGTSQIAQESEVPGGSLHEDTDRLPDSDKNVKVIPGSANTPGKNTPNDLTRSNTSLPVDLRIKDQNESYVSPAKGVKGFAIESRPTESYFIPIPVKQFYLNASSPTASVAIREIADTNVSQATRRYYLSFSAGIKTTWLLNNHTYKSLQKESFEYLNRQYYPVASVGLGVKFRNRYSLEGNLVLLDFGGQHVNYLDEGRSVQLQTRLQYLTFEALGGYHFKRVLQCFRFSVYPSAYLGIYSSALIQSNMATNDLHADRSKSFRAGDFGLNGRVGFAINARENIQIQSGLGVQSGFINISRTKPGIPAYFDRSFNASCSAFISVKYFFK